LLIELMSHFIVLHARGRVRVATIRVKVL
jgi:hypothetical protein